MPAGVGAPPLNTTHVPFMFMDLRDRCCICCFSICGTQKLTHCVDYNHPHTAVLQESPVIVSLNFIPTSVDDPTFVLTCTSTNRPPTYITWTRDGTELSDDSIHSMSQSLINRELATYVNTLTVTGRLTGQYGCHVTTEGWESQQNFTQSASKNIIVIGMSVLVSDMFRCCVL